MPQRRTATTRLRRRRHQTPLLVEGRIEAASPTERGRSPRAFCGNDTSDDPRYVRIDLSWPYSEATQQLGAHMACLEAALQPDFPLADGID